MIVINNMIGVEMSRTELIAFLPKSDSLNIFVEGKEDWQVCRILQQLLSIPDIDCDIWYCNGVNNLFEIYKQRAKFSQTRVVFIADKDMKVFTGIPKEFEGIGFTTGYSIENDLYTDCEDFLLDTLLYEKEKAKFKFALNEVLEWFAFEVEHHLKQGTPNLNEFGKPTRFDINLLSPKYMGKKKQKMNLNFLKDRQFQKASNNIRKDLVQNYGLKLRGKLLFQLLQKIFQERTKLIAHRNPTLLDICCRIAFQKQDSNIQKLANFIREGLSK